MELSGLKCSFVITEKLSKVVWVPTLKPVECLACPEDEKLYAIKHLQEYIKKPKSFEAIVVNYFLAMSNPMVQQAKTPHPGGATMS